MSHIIGYPGHDLLIPDIVRAENGSLFDAKGKRYVDLESGVWCTCIGHSNPEVLNAINEQFGQIAHVGFCYSAEVVEHAAQRVLSLAGFEEGKCVFLCSGSEANEYGMRVAQMVAPRPVLLTMSDSYFGAYGTAHSKREEDWFQFDWSGCANCTRRKPCDGQCPVWDRIPFGQLGGFVFEPGSSMGLVRFPPHQLITSIASRIKDDHGLLIVNEVTTGMGRTGEWFGYQHYGIEPDIVAMGKGIGNGYPVSATVLSSGVTSRLGSRTIPYAQSHQNDATGAAVALCVIDFIEENRLLERCNEISRILLDGLDAIRRRFPVVADVRGRGLMAAIEFDPEADLGLAERLHRELVDAGYILVHRPGHNVLRLDPCLTIEMEDIHGFLATLKTLLGRIEEKKS